MDTYNLELSFAHPSDRATLVHLWTDADGIGAWFGPTAVTTRVDAYDFRVGGRYRYVMVNDSGSEFIVGGRFLAIDLPNRIAFTWKWAHDSDTPASNVEIRFEDTMEGSLFRLHHDCLQTEDDVANHRDGWESSFEALRRYLDAQPDA